MTGFLIGLGIGLSIGGWFMYWLDKHKYRPDGTFIIDYLDPMKDTYRLEVDDLANIHTKKHVVLRVDCYMDNSQK